MATISDFPNSEGKVILKIDHRLKILSQKLPKRLLSFSERSNRLSVSVISGFDTWFICFFTFVSLGVSLKMSREFFSVIYDSWIKTVTVSKMFFKLTWLLLKISSLEPSRTSKFISTASSTTFWWWIGFLSSVIRRRNVKKKSVYLFWNFLLCFD